MARGKQFAPRKMARSNKKDAQEPALANIQSLPVELISTILALTGRPAAYASVCRAWKDVLHDGSGATLWDNVDLYGIKGTASYVPSNGSPLCTWLRQRAKSVQSITFHRFRVQAHQVFISTALGLLSFSPLRRLSFDHCVLNTELLLALRVTTGITQLRLCSLSGFGGDLEANKLGEALASLPLLEDLEVQYNPSSRATEFSWPAAITTCTWLTRLVVERFTDLPSSIGHLVRLQSLSVSGTGLKALPASIGLLTRLTSLTDSLVGSDYSFASNRLVIRQEAAGLTALRRLALVTMDMPANLSLLTAVTNLSVGRVSPWSQASADQLQAAVSQMKGLRRLRLHQCHLTAINIVGLPGILGVLPNLQELRLDGNYMHTLESGDLGPHVGALRKLDLGNSHFMRVPTELQRASGCRHLTITISVGSLRPELGDPADVHNSPLLAMPRLRSLALQQRSWDCESVEAVLNLRQAFDAKHHQGGRMVAITCPRGVQPSAPPPPPPLHDAILGGAHDDDDDWDSQDEDYYDDVYGGPQDPYGDPYDSFSDEDAYDDNGNPIVMYGAPYGY